MRAILGALSMLAALAWTSQARAETVRVHVASPVPVQIEARLGSHWETVCTSPCDVDLPAGQLVRVTGEDLRPSAPTTISAGSRVTLTVDPQREPSRGGPITAMVLGSVGLLPATFVLGTGALFVGFSLVACARSPAGTDYGACVGGVAGPFATAAALPQVWVPGIVGALVLSLGIATLPGDHDRPSTGITQTPAVAPRWDVGAPRTELPAVPSVTLFGSEF